MSQVQSGNGELQEEYQEVQIGPEKLEIPEKWTVTTVSDVASRFISGGTPDSGNEDYWGGEIPWTTAAVVEGPQFDGEKDFITREGLENSSASIVPEGSILFGTRVNVANVGRTAKEIAISQDLTGIVLDESKVDPDFFTWYLLFNQSKIKNRYSQGSTIQGMLTDDLKSLPLISPPLPEQRRIAEILSTVNEQIQQTDEIKGKFEELKKGIAQMLLDKGARSESENEVVVGPLSVSLPESWELRRLENFPTPASSVVQTGPYGSKLQKEEFTDSGYKIYRQANINSGDFEEGDQYVTEEKYRDLEKYQVVPGDVLLTRMGTIGDAAVLPDDARKGIMDYHLFRIRIDPSFCLPEYLSGVLRSSRIVKHQIESFSHGAIMDGLNTGLINEIRIPVPPTEEQREIVDILSTIDQTVSIEEERKTELKQLKRGLMQDLLTGKVRVNTD
ncbi:restriction endonuclease subunit S [Halorubrum cibi]|uniref:Type I restriction enzyme, S subunit n=1 Tax=Halorubrum cibi TaxID=413815 RepID=A0A521AL31_9EURY|nr:restriction endonuclease subunit S [Halorubrum cibi]SMO35516.1 type I restriction enzyme, S subunit [Halorubrum cibi]